MDIQSAQTIAEWQYEPPYDRYTIEPADRAEVAAFFTDPHNAYYTMRDDAGELHAFCCFGFDARVPGGNYSAEALDLGMGVRPDLTGQGRGASFATALCDFAQQHYAPAALRVTVAAFNERALRVWRGIGFVEVQRFLRLRDSAPFVILVREHAVDAATTDERDVQMRSSAL